MCGSLFVILTSLTLAVSLNCTGDSVRRIRIGEGNFCPATVNP